MAYTCVLIFEIIKIRNDTFGSRYEHNLDTICV